MHIASPLAAAPFTVELTPIILGVLTLLGVGLGTWATIRKVRADRATAREAQTELKPPSFGEMWGMLQDLRGEFDQFKALSATKDRAMGNVLQDIAEQWPDEHAPLLNPADIETLRDTIPAAWRNTGPGVTLGA